MQAVGVPIALWVAFCEVQRARDRYTNATNNLVDAGAPSRTAGTVKGMIILHNPRLPEEQWTGPIRDAALARFNAESHAIDRWGASTPQRRAILHNFRAAETALMTAENSLREIFEGAIVQQTIVAVTFDETATPPPFEGQDRIAKEGEETCITCMENAIRVTIKPCNHSHLCGLCYTTVVAIGHPAKCPVCRSVISGFEEI